MSIANVDPNNGGRVALMLPGTELAAGGHEVLAVEVSTKPLINLVWIGAVVMLASAFLAALRRALDLRRSDVRPARAA